MSFFKKLFGGEKKPAEAIVGASESYEGVTLSARPIPEGDQWRLAGAIEKPHGDEVLSRSFVRADLFSSREQAESFALRKARQIVDERGDRLFADGEPDGRV
jgi:hypothetical protein